MHKIYTRLSEPEQNFIFNQLAKTTTFYLEALKNLWNLNGNQYFLVVALQQKIMCEKAK